jgi:hypothetical protein
MPEAKTTGAEIEKKQKKKKKKGLSKFTLLRCLELYFKDDHDQALLLTEFIWKKKDKM